MISVNPYERPSFSFAIKTFEQIDLERKIEQAFKWIDILDFFKTFNNSFGSGSRG